MKKLGKIILLFSLGLALCGGLVYVANNSHYLYIGGEYLGINCDEIDVELDSPVACTEVSVEELKKDGRVTFDQSMMLVNTEYRLAQDFVPQISEYKTSGVQMSNCMHTAYNDLSVSVKENADDNLYVSSHFRTAEKQQNLYDEDPTTATEPGASEHQTGLALDVYVRNYSGDGFVQSEAGQYVNSNCWKYGFIIRYPVFGEKETGIRFEPWHIRYVGQPHAEIIYNNHVTLEEYISSMEVGVWYGHDDYLYSRQEMGDTIQLPMEYSEVVISPDNTGSYIVTVR